MLGAIAGDIVGSVYENFPTKRKDFSLFTPESTFTDDSVLTIAVADAILTTSDYGGTIKSYARKYPMRGYGAGFMKWMLSPADKPYYSYGNGSAMRVSPVGHAFNSEKDLLREAKRSAECTHNHPDGITGAQATALAIFMARSGSDKQSIRTSIENRFDYDLSRTIDEVRPGYTIDLTCPGSVPESIIAFLDSNSFEDAVRNAISLGGDADTQASIAGAIAEAHYRTIPLEILTKIRKILTKSLWHKTQEFYHRFGIPEIIDQVNSLNDG